MTPEEFDSLFGQFRHTAFRLETLPAYNVGGEEAKRIAAFQAGQPRPERSVRTSRWLQRIALTTINQGKRWQRVRVIDDPPTEYERYQLDSYVESQAAGEEIRVLSRGLVPASYGVDFWLFDNLAVAVMDYDDAGRFGGATLVTDPVETANFVTAARLAMRHSVPLNEYLAAHRDTLRAA